MIRGICWRNRLLRWFRHAERKRDDDWVKRCTWMEMEGVRPRGRPRKTWMKHSGDNMRNCFLSREDAKDKFMKRVDPWCEIANLDEPGHTISVFTNVMRRERGMITG
jgi:hypothetical protein